MKIILIPTDGSIRSLKACEFAVNNFSGKGYTVEIFHVKKPGGDIEEADLFIKNAKEIFSKSQFKELKSKIIETLTEVSKEIIMEAKSISAEIIIISRFGADRSESSTVSEAINEIANSCPCNVIIVK